MLRNTRFQQCDVFNDRVVLAVAPLRTQRLERAAPAVLNPPLRLVAGGGDRKVHCSVDQTNTCSTTPARTFGSQSKQTLRGSRAGDVRATSFDNCEVLSNVDLCAAPFLEQRSPHDGFGVHTEQFGFWRVAGCR